jgi:hypothetical protein
VDSEEAKRASQQSANGSDLHYSAQISDDGLAVLRSMIGLTVGTVYASCLQVAGQHLTAPAFSIPISSNTSGRWIHRYIVIRCDWFETPHTLTDYWRMSVSDEGAPFGIEMNSEEGLIAPCSIRFYHATPINKIDVYHFEESAGDEQCLEIASYDQAIHFQSANGRSFCIACQLNGPGIATEVHISEDPGTIRQFLDGSPLRLSIAD